VSVVSVWFFSFYGVIIDTLMYFPPGCLCVVCSCVVYILLFLLSWVDFHVADGEKQPSVHFMIDEVNSLPYVL